MILVPEVFLVGSRCHPRGNLVTSSSGLGSTGIFRRHGRGEAAAKPYREQGRQSDGKAFYQYLHSEPKRKLEVSVDLSRDLGTE